MSGQHHRFSVGAFVCTIFCDAVQERVAARLWPTVPPDELERGLASLGLRSDALPFSMNILVIETPDQRLLVDTGMGNGPLMENLTAAGIAPESIDRIIVTHGHGDHIGGIVRPDGTLHFPNARLTFWQSEWEFWLAQAESAESPNEMARHNLLPVRDRVDLIVQESEIAAGIRAIQAPGHTIAHMALLIESGGEKLLHLADAAHSPAQFTFPTWSPVFDYQPDIATATRRRLIEWAAREQLLTSAYHFPFPGLGYAVAAERGFIWQPPGN